MLNGVIAQKLQSLDIVLMELRSLGQLDTKQLDDDWRTKRAIERDLQVLVEIVIDVCQRFISLSGQSPAATSADAVERCINLGVLSNDEAYRQMVRFRNFIVHRYERIDTKILADMINLHLSDFEKFRDDVLAHVKND
jgi:uncharacterized protein YutE (UPF0331/DUF86 family)